MGFMDKILGRGTTESVGSDIDPQTGNFVKVADNQSAGSEVNQSPVDQLVEQPQVSLTELESQIEPVINLDPTAETETAAYTPAEASFVPHAEASISTPEATGIEAEQDSLIPTEGAPIVDLTTNPEQAASEVSTEEMQVIPGGLGNAEDAEVQPTSEQESSQA